MALLVGEADHVEQLGGALGRLGRFDMPSTVIGASMQFCSAVMCGKRLKYWNTMPILARIRRMCAGVAGHQPPPFCMWVSGSPSTQMTPSLIVSSVISMRSTVVLPEPEGPMIDDLLAAGDVEVELVEHGERAVALGDVVEADHGAASLIGWASGSGGVRGRGCRAAETRLMTRKKTPTSVIGSM